MHDIMLLYAISDFFMTSGLYDIDIYAISIVIRLIGVMKFNRLTSLFIFEKENIIVLNINRTNPMKLFVFIIFFS